MQPDPQADARDALPHAGPDAAPDAAAAAPLFAGLPLGPTQAAFLARAGIEAANEVQTLCQPPISAGRDVVVHAGTGTGKTLAYMMPLLARLAGAQARGEPHRLLVLAPTPELAMQILRVAEGVKAPGTASLGLIGGANPERQRDRLKKHPSILVGTPGRVLELVAAKKLKLPTLGALVLDELDAMLASQHADALARLAADRTLRAQRICATATLSDGAERFLGDCFAQDPVRIVTGAAPLKSNISHLCAHVARARREVTLLHLWRAHRPRQALIFVNKLGTADHLAEFLNEHGVAAMALTGQANRTQRVQAMHAVRSGKVVALVATDAAARGIDIPRLTHVIHFEVARDAPTYLHRAGRVGRAGAHGTSLTLVGPQEAHLLQRYRQALGFDIVDEASLKG